jgi:hypothetical protein
MPALAKISAAVCLNSRGLPITALGGALVAPPLLDGLTAAGGVMHELAQNASQAPNTESVTDERTAEGFTLAF